MRIDGMTFEPRDQLDMFESERLRDEGIERVTGHSLDFIISGLIAIATLPGGEYTGEAIRIELTKQDIKPHHHNGWGALIMQALRQGLIVDTGRVAKSRIKTNHARKASIYQTVKR